MPDLGNCLKQPSTGEVANYFPGKFENIRGSRSWLPRLHYSVLHSEERITRPTRSGNQKSLGGTVTRKDGEQPCYDVTTMIIVLPVGSWTAHP